MNLPEGIRSPVGGQNAGAGQLARCTTPASAEFQVGEIGFGPCWQDDEPTLRELYDKACQSIVRMEQEAEEARATLATWEVERGILVRELERLREMVAEECARDAACAEKCRDKAAADGGWANI